MGDEDLKKLKKNELIELIQETISPGKMSEKPKAKIQIEPFKGVNDDIDATDWIELYELLTEDALWTDNSKVIHLPSYLKGLAIKWYFNNIKGKPNLTWQVIKYLFVSNFGYTNKPSLTTINNTKWNRERESFVEYYQNKLAMCSRAGLSGALLLDTLTDGLPDNLRVHVQSLDPEASPNTWFSLIQRAIDRSNFRAEQKKPKLEVNAMEDHINSSIRKEIQELKEEVKEIRKLIENITLVRANDESKQKYQCSECGMSNHPTDRCFKLIGYPNRRSKKQQVNAIGAESSGEESLSELNEIEICKVEAKLRSEFQESEENDLVFLPLVINSKLRVNALVDSGSNVTAIDHQYCIDNNINITSRKISLIGATNRFESFGVTELDIESNGNKVRLEATVLKLVKQQFILGKGDFRKFGIELNGPNLRSKQESSQMQTINTLSSTNEPEELDQVNDLVEKYSQAFGKHEFHVGVCKLITCKITLEPNSKPITARPRKLSLSLQEEEKRQVNQLLEHNLIRPSSSSWASGITFAMREGRSPRLCGDYRYLNIKTIADQYPIPNIENIILQFRGAEVYSTLDVVRGYNHIEIDPKDRYLTAFTTNIGLYEWNRMPFGLKNAPAVFQRLMDRLLKLHEEYARAYFDDIIIYSRNIHDHLTHLESVFKTIIAFNLKLKRSKCQFIRESINFCGYQITGNKISRDAKFIEAIAKLEKPSNVSQLQSFLGLVNYGSRFVSNFAALCKPLNNLRKKNVLWNWTAEHDAAFHKLKQILMEAPQLYLFNTRLETILYCDASKYAIAGVLLQQSEEELRIIGYYSRTLTDAQVNYNIYTKELLAVVKSVEFFKQLLYGKTFKVVTDNSALAFFKSSKQVFDKYTRWLLFLEDFDIKIEHVKGTNNVLADSITRIKRQVNVILEGRRDIETPNIDSLDRIFDIFHLKLGNHVGFSKMKDSLKQRYHIEKLDSHLRNYLSKCKPCNLVNQHVKRSGKFHPKPPGLPNTRWHSDILGPFPVSRNFNNVLVIVDHTTRFAQAYLMSKLTTEATIQAFKRAFENYGRPRILVTDNGPSFRGNEFVEFLKLCDVEHILTPTYHSAANGIAERFNKTIKEALIKFMLDDPRREWSNLLPILVSRYNSTRHRVTGFTPRELMQNSGNFRLANERTIRQQTYDSNRLNKKRVRPLVQVGSKILVDNPRRFQGRFAPRRIGPFKVVKKINDEIVVTDRKLPCFGKEFTIHSKNIKVIP